MEKQITCPHCGYHNDTIIICDNDCGTFICVHCDLEYYLSNDNVSIKGHNPKCNNSDISDTSDDNEDI